MLAKHGLQAAAAVIMLFLAAGCGTSDSKPSLSALNEISAATMKANETGNSAANAMTEGVNGDSPSDSAAGSSVDTESSLKRESDMQDNGNHDMGNTGGNLNEEIAEELLLQSTTVDIDGDGRNEQVKVIQADGRYDGKNEREIIGLLEIRSDTQTSRIVFCRKSSEVSAVLSDIRFEDLDGDGTKDIFITIPDSGASFSYSTYFIYSYKKNLCYSFENNCELSDFIGGFSFKSKNAGILSLINNDYNFTAELTIESMQGEQTSDDHMSEYERKAWIDPVPVDIDEGSKLALVKEAGGVCEIKVPLPIFGLAAVDMIGELDLYYAVNSGFTPVLKHFEVLDFNGEGKKKAGSCDLSKAIK